MGLVVPSGPAFELLLKTQGGWLPCAVSGSKSFCRRKGAGCPAQSRAPGAFVDTEAGCPAVVSGSGDARAWTDTPLPSRSTESERG